MSSSKIFISYSHKDEKYKNELLNHLRVLELQGVASFWDTSLIPAGGVWSDEIDKAIENARMAILLISPYFLSSDFVIKTELPLLLEKAKKRNTLVLPILVSPCSWTSVPELAQFQFLNDVRTPLSISKQIEDDYALISQRIADLVLANREEQESKSRVLLNENKKQIVDFQQNNRHVFLSHSKFDGDFAELMKLRLEKEGITAWIDNDRLEPGVDWRQEIDESIKEAKALIAIMSPEARESEYVTYEWAFAWGSGVKILPVMLRETPLHPRLAALQYIDFTNRRARPWDRLIKSILNEKK